MQSLDRNRDGNGPSWLDGWLVFGVWECVSEFSVTATGLEAPLAIKYVGREGGKEGSKLEGSKLEEW